MAAKTDTKAKKAKKPNIVEHTIHGYSYENEYVAMGQLFANPNAAYDIACGLGINDNDWGESDHAKLWQAIEALHRTDTPVLAISVKEHLELKGIKLSNPQLVDIYSESAPDFSSDGKGNSHFATRIAFEQIKEWTNKRKFGNQSAKAVQSIYTANGDTPEKAIAEAAQLTDALHALNDRLDELDQKLIQLPANDYGNAQAIHLAHPEYTHTNELGWLKYDGAKWESRLAEKSLMQAAIEVIERRHYLAKLTDKQDFIRATKANKSTIKNAIELLGGAIAYNSIDEFDNDSDLLNCKNGVVNLRTGDLIPHDSSQKFTYMIPVDYDPKADYSAWEEWLWGTLTPASQGDAKGDYLKLVEWLRLAIGYSLTGETLEQCMFYVHGPSRAGKGTFLQIISALLGSRLASGVDASTLTAKRSGDSQNFDLAPLKQNRVVTVSETERRGRLNDRMVKAMTGDDPIRCAFKFGTPFSYTPQFKIWVTSNFKVSADPIDTALWGRLRIIEFPNSHLGQEDKTLKKRLLADLPAVLNWAVKGAIQWYDLIDQGQGLPMPDMMKDLVQKHRDANDTIAQFIADMCEADPNNIELKTPVNALRPAYNNWCNENELKPFGARSLNESMIAKGFESKPVKIKGQVSKHWIGINLK